MSVRLAIRFLSGILSGLVVASALLTICFSGMLLSGHSAQQAAGLIAVPFIGESALLPSAFKEAIILGVIGLFFTLGMLGGLLSLVLAFLHVHRSPRLLAAYGISSMLSLGALFYFFLAPQGWELSLSSQVHAGAYLGSMAVSGAAFATLQTIEFRLLRHEITTITENGLNEAADQMFDAA